MTVYKNVAFGLEERKFSSKEINKRVNNALDLVGLLGLVERRPSQLSGGQQQRVALARTIVIEPRVLLLDEPLSNLDSNLRVKMRRDIIELQRKLKLTTIFVTHDQEEANTTSDRIAVLDEGVIQQVGSPVELYDEPVNRFVADFLGTANFIEGQVVSTNGSYFFHSRGGTIIPLASIKQPIPDHCTAMFRPQDILLISEGDSISNDNITLSGVINNIEFLGNLFRYNVTVGEDIFIVDDSHSSGRKSLSVGENVKLSLNTSQVRIFQVS